MRISLPSLSLPRKKQWIALCLSLIFLCGMGIGYLHSHVFSTDSRFTAFTDQIFESEVTGSTLTLHYTLADPERFGITRPEVALGEISSDSSEALALCKSYTSTLLSYDPEKLDTDHQITRDTLLLYFHTQEQLLASPLLYEPLGPSLGIQAQLPVLLAEYSFGETQDILDYLKLLTQVDDYFESIFAFECQKSQAGLFMSDTTLDRIQEQCRAFIADPKSNYMLEIFEEKIRSFPGLTDEEIEGLISRHQELILNEVIPAYENLIDNLETLRGTGQASSGLAAFPGGSDYYKALLSQETGVYDSMEQIESRLTTQLSADTRQISLMLTEQPSLVTKLTDDSLLPDETPEEIVAYFSEALSSDFPELTDVSPEIRTVHESMEDYLSPAFYLTPPLDTQTPNVIYINEKNDASGLELFTTLAHEGFPGHLYQTVSFARSNSSPIRHLLATDGYTEGWATYIESWAAKQCAGLIEDPAAADIATLYWLNRSVNLCIYSLMDLGIHYHGWDSSAAGNFLAAFGIGDEALVQEIYQYIVETPGNYLKYYLGCLNFMDLKDAQEEKQGTAFSLQAFHQKVLSIGPVPFPVLEKYIDVI